MKTRMMVVCAIFLSGLCAFAADRWQDPARNLENRLPARAWLPPQGYVKSLNSVWRYWWCGWPDMRPRDCYADTSTIGFLSEGWEVRILGCTYLYNMGCIRNVKPEKLDKMYVFKQPGGSMLVADSQVVKQHKPTVIYEGNGRARFRDIIYNGNGYNPGELKPGACAFKMDPPAAKPAN